MEFSFSSLPDCVIFWTGEHLKNDSLKYLQLPEVLNISPIDSVLRGLRFLFLFLLRIQFRGTWLSQLEEHVILDLYS